MLFLHCNRSREVERNLSSPKGREGYQRACLQRMSHMLATPLIFLTRTTRGISAKLCGTQRRSLGGEGGNRRTPEPATIKIECYPTDKRDQCITLCLFGRPSTPDSHASTAARSQHNVGIMDSTGSINTLATTRTWLGECLRDHTEVCAVNHDNIYRIVPSRLIGIHGSLEPLTLEDDGNPAAQSLVLSYCWGQRRSSGLKLQRSNEKDLHKNIPSEALP